MSFARRSRQCWSWPRKKWQVSRRVVEKPRRNLLSVFESAGSKIEAQKTRHPQKFDEDPFEISKNPPRICDRKIFLTPKIRVSSRITIGVHGGLICRKNGEFGEKSQHFQSDLQDWIMASKCRRRPTEIKPLFAEFGPQNRVLQRNCTCFLRKSHG